MQRIRKEEKMSKRSILFVFILSVTFLVSIFLFMEKQRYSLVISDKGFAYKIDRQTGKLWFIRGSMIEPIGIEIEDEKGISLNDQAIHMTTSSYVLDPSTSMGEYARELASGLKGDLSYNGWNAYEITSGVFLVGFTVTRENGTESGIFFETIPNLNIIRSIKGDSLLEVKYGLEEGARMTDATYKIISQ